MTHCITKIDLVGSKQFSRQREAANPPVRAEILKKLLAAAAERFPYAGQTFPKGSFYKAEGDAAYYILEKPSVALRAAIAFMQDWHGLVTEGYPECRILLHMGHLDFVDVPGGTDVVGKPFEDISVVEKDLGDGEIYVSRKIIDSSDSTMTKFGFYREWPKYDLTLYRVDFLDPRTFSDSSLVHAVFVANPEAAEARDRVFELLLVQYVQEHGQIEHISKVQSWAQKNSYSLPPAEQLSKLLSSSEFIEVDEEAGTYKLSKVGKMRITTASAEYKKSQSRCIQIVGNSITKATGSTDAISTVDLPRLIDEYLSAIFSEIRLMANYFRGATELFNTDADAFRRFDYVITRHLNDVTGYYLHRWRDTFIVGLAQVAKEGSLYIAAVFHNVLGTYYLNRARAASPYQLQKLQSRQLYADTNLLYAHEVEASNFHEMLTYIVSRLQRIGVYIKLFPFSIEEYEQSLSNVEHLVRSGDPQHKLLTRNPWLYQEFRRNPRKYLNSITVCREIHSVRAKLQKDEYQTVDEYYDDLEPILAETGFQLEREFALYDHDAALEEWVDLRNLMPSDYWSSDRYWEFINKQNARHDAQKIHDVHIVKNVERRAKEEGDDGLGPRVLLITLDIKQVGRLRKEFPFIITVQQFLEFMLPYLFLSDIPISEPTEFPNVLLTAQLAALLVKEPPAVTDTVRAFLVDNSWRHREEQNSIDQFGAIARVLNSDRLKTIVHDAEQVAEQVEDPEAIKEISRQLGEVVEEYSLQESRRYFRDRLSEDLQTVKTRLEDQETEIRRLQRTVRYWRQQAREKTR